MLYLDLDCLSVIAGTLTNKRKLPKISLNYEVENSKGLLSYTYESSLDELNSHVFNTEGSENVVLRITSLKCSHPENINTETWRLILNNLLIVFD